MTQVTESVLHESLAKCKGTVEEQIKQWLEDHEKTEIAKYDVIHSQLIEVQTQLAAVLRVFEQAKGALTFVRWLAVIAAGGWAFIVWAKDHIKL